MFRIIVKYYCVRPPRYCLDCLNVVLITIISNYCRGRFCENWRFYPTYCNCYLLILILIIMIVINAVIIPTLRERKPQWFWRADILRPGCRAHISMLSWVQVDKIQCNFNFNLHFSRNLFFGRPITSMFSGEKEGKDSTMPSASLWMELPLGIIVLITDI